MCREAQSSPVYSHSVLSSPRSDPRGPSQGLYFMQRIVVRVMVPVSLSCSGWPHPPLPRVPSWPPCLSWDFPSFQTILPGSRPSCQWMKIYSRASSQSGRPLFCWTPGCGGQAGDGCLCVCTGVCSDFASVKPGVALHPRTAVGTPTPHAPTSP